MRERVAPARGGGVVEPERGRVVRLRREQDRPDRHQRERRGERDGGSPGVAARAPEGAARRQEEHQREEHPGGQEAVA